MQIPCNDRRHRILLNIIISVVVFFLVVGALAIVESLIFAKEEAQCSIICLEIEKIVVLSLTAENNKEARRKEKEDDVQKESTLQPITKANTKLERELQEWEVESTKGGANGGGG